LRNCLRSFQTFAKTPLPAVYVSALSAAIVDGWSRRGSKRSLAPAALARRLRINCPAF
jgi:hypothetical protein